MRVHAVRYWLYLTALLGLTLSSCQPYRLTQLYRDDAELWKLALLPDSTFVLQAKDEAFARYVTYGEFRIRDNWLTLQSSGADRIPLKVTSSGTRGRQARVVQVFDCKGRALDWRHVVLHLDTTQLLGTGNSYDIPPELGQVANLQISSPPGNVNCTRVQLTDYTADTIRCYVQLPADLLYPMRPLIIAPQPNALKVALDGLTLGSASIAVINGPSFPREWRLVTKKREKRLLLRSMPALDTHSCPR